MCNRFDRSCCELDPGPKIPVRLRKLGRVGTYAISNLLLIFCSLTGRDLNPRNPRQTVVWEKGLGECLWRARLGDISRFEPAKSSWTKATPQIRKISTTQGAGGSAGTLIARGKLRGYANPSSARASEANSPKAPVSAVVLLRQHCRTFRDPGYA